MGDPPNVLGATRATDMLEVMGLLQTGRVGLGFIGAAQVDRFGNLNSTRVHDASGKWTRLPGKRRRLGYRVARRAAGRAKGSPGATIPRASGSSHLAGLWHRWAVEGESRPPPGRARRRHHRPRGFQVPSGKQGDGASVLSSWILTRRDRVPDRLAASIRGRSPRDTAAERGRAFAIEKARRRWLLVTEEREMSPVPEKEANESNESKLVTMREAVEHFVPNGLLGAHGCGSRGANPFLRRT